MCLGEHFCEFVDTRPPRPTRDALSQSSKNEVEVRPFSRDSISDCEGAAPLLLLAAGANGTRRLE